MFVFSCCEPNDDETEAIRYPKQRGSLSHGGGEMSTLPPSLDSGMIRSKSESRILKTPSFPRDEKRRQSGSSQSARSLYEASAYRVASHVTNSLSFGSPDADHGGLPNRFLEAYMAALRDGNTTWATTDTAIGEMFASNARLITQDKKTIDGRINVLKRLDQGVDTLIKMAGQDAVIPEWDVKGPVLTAAMEHRFTCTIKRGVVKLSFTLDFLIIQGKITLLRNTRV